MELTPKHMILERPHCRKQYYPTSDLFPRLEFFLIVETSSKKLLFYLSEALVIVGLMVGLMVGLSVSL